MVRAALSGVTLVASVLLSALAVQVPLVQDYRPATPNVDHGDHTDWALDKLPNSDATDHLVFETVYSLLQHWPNTRMRNGHNIVPGVIPKGTLLYHGTDRQELPSGAEWIALDPEHAYFFCREPFLASSGHSSSGCWKATLVTTRPLNVIYFDGSSAAKVPDGPLDTQDLLAWGDSPHGLWDEIQRVEDLCEWGKGVGVDGFVRMEMAFEVILCDFSTGISLVSFVNLLRPKSITSLAIFETVHAGTWHNRFPGETRIQLDLTRLVSFYDTQLAPSLVPIRTTQERWDHRVRNVSSGDFLAMKSKLEASLTRPSVKSSGVDWRALTQVIVDRFAGRLELTHHLLNSLETNPDDILELANKTQIQFRIMLTPYILFSATPTDPLDKTDLDWAIPIYRHCSTTHTYPMESELESMTDSEKLILQAVRGTTREICRVVTKMWAAGVYAGIDQSLNTNDSPDVPEVIQVWTAWREDLDRLMTWLDWSVWVKCDPACGPEEMCYLPTWPADFPCYPGGPFPHGLTSFDLPTKDFPVGGPCNGRPDVDTDWVRPKPKCIRRFEPFDFLPRD